MAYRVSVETSYFTMANKFFQENRFTSSTFSDVDKSGKQGGDRPATQLQTPTSRLCSGFVPLDRTIHMEYNVNGAI